MSRHHPHHETIAVNHGDTLKINGVVLDDTTIKLNQGTIEFGMLVHEPTAAMLFMGDIANFGPGDTIKVDDVWTDLTSRSNLLTLTPIDAGHTYLDLWLSGAHDAHIKLDDGIQDIHGLTLGRSGDDAVISFRQDLIPPHV